MWTTQELKLGHTKELGYRASMSKTAALPVAVAPSRYPIYSLPTSLGIWNVAHLGTSAGHCDLLLQLFQKILSLLFLAFLILIHVALYQGSTDQADST